MVLLHCVQLQLGRVDTFWSTTPSSCPDQGTNRLIWGIFCFWQCQDVLHAPIPLFYLEGSKGLWFCFLDKLNHLQLKVHLWSRNMVWYLDLVWIAAKNLLVVFFLSSLKSHLWMFPTSILPVTQLLVQLTWRNHTQILLFLLQNHTSCKWYRVFLSYLLMEHALIGNHWYCLYQVYTQS